MYIMLILICIKRLCVREWLNGMSYLGVADIKYDRYVHTCDNTCAREATFSAFNSCVACERVSARVRGRACGCLYENVCV